VKTHIEDFVILKTIPKTRLV